MSDTEEYFDETKPIKKKVEYNKYRKEYQRKYYADNIDKIKKRQKEYRDAHPEIYKNKIKCEICNNYYVKVNYKTHIKSQRHNKRIEENNWNERVQCLECKGYYLKNQKEKHKKTKRHILNKNNELNINMFSDIILN
jgi:hypothetical protein